jgi:hypothetical protein
MIRVSVLALALVVVSVDTTPADDVESYQEYVDRVDQAIAAGEGATAVDLLCQWTQDGRAAEYGKEDPARAVQLVERWNAFSHQRFVEVFQPPEHVAEYFPAKLLTWEDYGFFSTSFGGLRADSLRSEYGGGRLVLSRGSPVVFVDLDLDGTPEMTYDGDEPVIRDGLAVVHDDAGDGRREQWLIADHGEDPRQAARIWFYRDGHATSVIIKPDESINRCGRSWCFGYGL